jgi:hypothetical protein
MAVKKKETDEAVESVEVQSVQTMFTKEQILASSKYRNRRDLVDALLDENTSYTTETVDELVNSFLKGQVK